MAWSTYLTESGGRPGLAMPDRQFAGRPAPGQLPRLAWFGVWCRVAPRESFWDPAEGEALERVEEALLELASQVANGRAVYMRRLATRGIREYYLYAAAHLDFAPVLAQLQQRYPEYRVEYEHREDVLWEQYRTWLAEPSTPAWKPNERRVGRASDRVARRLLTSRTGAPAWASGIGRIYGGRSGCARRRSRIVRAKFDAAPRTSWPRAG